MFDRFVSDKKAQIAGIIMSVVGFAIALILIASVVIGSAFPTMIDAIAGLNRTNMTGATSAIVDLLPLITAVVIMMALFTFFFSRER